MNIEELFSGIGMVVDDQVYNKESGDKIIHIVENLESKGFPLVKYADVPNIKEIHISKFSFVLLDWELVNILDESGIPMPGGDKLKKDAMNSLLQFIRKIQESCYLPIFIFSNSAEQDIIKELRKQKLNIDTFPVFIKHKDEIIENGQAKVLEIIQDWINETPSIYVLKEWENVVNSAKMQTFKSLSTTKYWPLVIWKTADADSVDPNEEMLDILTQNIFGRMQPLAIDKEQLFKVEIKESTQDEVLNILQVQRLQLTPNKETSTTGDIYKIGKKYYLNIRPTCDCINRKGLNCDGCKEKNCVECPNANKVYLIQFDKLSSGQVSDLFEERYGTFKERNNEAILGPLMNNKFYSFKFQDVIIKKYDDIKNDKIGRILQPFIRHITERYALYTQRQALPRIPSQAISDENIGEGKEIPE